MDDLFPSKSTIIKLLDKIEYLQWLKEDKGDIDPMLEKTLEAWKKQVCSLAIKLETSAKVDAYRVVYIKKHPATKEPAAIVEKIPGVENRWAAARSP